MDEQPTYMDEPGVVDRPELERGVTPIDPNVPDGACLTDDGSIDLAASRELPRNRSHENQAKRKDHRMALQMANASLRSLMGRYEMEVTYSRCVFSSDVSTQAHLPRSCQRGHGGPEGVSMKICNMCKDFTLGPEIIEIEDLWPETAFTTMLIAEDKRLFEERQKMRQREAAKKVDGGCGCGKKKPKQEKQKGIGSALELVFSKLGFKSCKSCKKRRDFLNKITPFKKK